MNKEPDAIWERYISLNSAADVFSDHIGLPSHYLAQDDGSVDWDKDYLPLAQALSQDQAPLPATADREGYYGDNHFNYWASGLRDYCEIMAWASERGLTFTDYLDLGAASGRVVRAFDSQGGIKTYACDINRRHVDWMAFNLPPSICVFQNHSIPSIPLPDASLDLVTAFSVFTHVEAFDTTWLMEIRRILRPGGIAWLTIHGDRTWREVEPSWPLYEPLQAHPDHKTYGEQKELPKPRLVYRFSNDRSYSSNVFCSYDYVRRVWGRIMPVIEIRPAVPFYQDVVVLRR